jgi:hypothetical protein
VRPFTPKQPLTLVWSTRIFHRCPQWTVRIEGFVTLKRGRWGFQEGQPLPSGLLRDHQLCSGFGPRSRRAPEMCFGLRTSQVATPSAVHRSPLFVVVRAGVLHPRLASNRLSVSRLIQMRFTETTVGHGLSVRRSAPTGFH